MTTKIAHPFDLSAVQLLDGPIRRRQERNRQYLLGLHPDRLLHNFRINAGLGSNALPLGGWEAPDQGLRGHFVGHYLAACAMTYRAMGDVELKQRADLLVHELAKCQNALGGGYLSAFPASDLDAIETRFEGAWAPYYVLHKILAGLVEVYLLCGNAQALHTATRLADYILARIAKLNLCQLDGMCRTDQPNPANEFGGMSEALLDLALLSGNDMYLKLAQAFEPDWFLKPLEQCSDQLTGLHANTHIPIILGAVRRYELSGEERFRHIAEYFWERTAIARSYVNGGSSGPRPDGLEKSTGGEHWPEAFLLAKTLTPKINESCVAHNMMRLSDKLFQWSADVRYAQFYERVFFNSVLCMQHPAYPGGYIYSHPLAECSCKEYGHADDTFWCCYGTSIEAFSRLAGGIYYHNADSLWVNLMVDSALDWRERGVRIEQHANLTQYGNATWIIRCDDKTTFTLNIRVPHWASKMELALNDDRPLDVRTSSGFMSIRREWRNGDELTARFECPLRCETMQDDRTLIAFFHGPLLLAARTEQRLQLAARSESQAIALITRKADDPGVFSIQLKNGFKANLTPLNEIVDEPFGAYFRLS